MEILKWLETSSAVKDFTVLDYKSFKGGFYIKIKAALTDDSVIFIKEYADQNERNYSYHWQDINDKMIIRWDNSPHHPKLFNSPHHKHTEGKTLPSSEIVVKDILVVIEKELNNSPYAKIFI